MPPHLSLVAAQDHYALISDQRQVLDLAVNLCAAFGSLTVIAAVLLADDGLWCFGAVLPLALAYLCYRGAVAAAGAYASAVSTVTDLSRFALYRALHLTMPEDADSERTTAETLVSMVSGNEVSTTFAPANDAMSDQDKSSVTAPNRTPLVVATGWAAMSFHGISRAWAKLRGTT